VLPALIFLTAFMVYPVANLIYLSFTTILRSALPMRPGWGSTTTPPP
jgi:ABC-type sugar transport system permease subunit